MGRNGGMGSGWSPGGLPRGRRFRWKKKGFQDCGNNASKGMEKESGVEGVGSDGGHTKEGPDTEKTMDGFSKEGRKNR